MERQDFPPADPPRSVDLARTSLVAAHIALLTAERQALWQRYTALLLANAILLGFLIQLQTPTKILVYFASGFGVALCLAWLGSTLSGMRLSRLRLDASSRFVRAARSALEGDANPLLVDTQRAQWPQGGGGVRMALAIIGLFVLGYVCLLAQYLYYMFFFVEGRR